MLKEGLKNAAYAEEELSLASFSLEFFVAGGPAVAQAIPPDVPRHHFVGEFTMDRGPGGARLYGLAGSCPSVSLTSPFVYVSYFLHGQAHLFSGPSPKMSAITSPCESSMSGITLPCDVSTFYISMPVRLLPDPNTSSSNPFIRPVG
jgi:hypothetical protein